MTSAVGFILWLAVAGSSDSTLARRAVDEEWDDEHAEQSAWLRDHPLDLNTATLSELEEIPGITAGEVLALVALRGRLGRFRTVEDICLLGEDLCRRIREFVIVMPGVRGGSAVRPAFRAKMERVVDGTSAEAFAPGEGSGWRVRGALEVPVRSTGIVRLATESDPGERWKYGFVSVSVDLKARGPVSRVLLGDYHVSAGQGLALCGSGYFSGSTDPRSLIRPAGRTLAPHRSFGETGFLRGLAVGLGTMGQKEGVQGTVFLSRLTLAASTDEEGAITAIDNSGLVRTEGEVLRQRAVRESVGGLRLAGRGGTGWNAGGSVIFHGLDRALALDGAADVGKAGRTAGRVLALDGSFVSPSCVAAGEIAASRQGGKAWVIRVLLAAAARMRFAAEWRVFEPGYFAPTGILSPDHGGGGNERGGTLRWDLTPAPWCVLAGSAEVSRSITRNTRERGPRGKIRFTLSADMRVNPSTDISVRLRLEETERSLMDSDSAGRDVRRTVEWRSEGARLTLAFRATRDILLRTRLESVRVGPGGARPAAMGLLVFNECRWSPSDRVSVSARITVTDVDSYDARVYAAETDSEGVTRIVAHSRPGVILSATARATPARGVRIGAGITWKDRYPAGGGQAGAEGFSSTEVALSLSLPL